MNSRILIILSIITIASAKMGDKIPFCFFPKRFDTTVQPMAKDIDVNKYQGTWYEVARSMSLSEINCVCS